MIQDISAVLQNLVNELLPNVKVKISTENEFYCVFDVETEKETIYIPYDFETWKSDFYSSLQPYLLLDKNFDYTKYCSYPMFCFAHEVGHTINGWIENHFIYLARVNMLPKGLVGQATGYLDIPDELEAWRYAMMFVKKYQKEINEVEKGLGFA